MSVTLINMENGVTNCLTENIEKWHNVSKTGEFTGNLPGDSSIARSTGV